MKQLIKKIKSIAIAWKKKAREGLEKIIRKNKSKYQKKKIRANINLSKKLKSKKKEEK